MGSPFEIHTNHIRYTLQLKKHLLNDVIWQDFVQQKKSTLRFNEIEPEQYQACGSYEIMPVRVNHPGDASRFIIQNKTASFLRTLGTERIWQVAKEYKNLKAIFTRGFRFQTSSWLLLTVNIIHRELYSEEEIKKMPKDIPYFLGHLK